MKVLNSIQSPGTLRHNAKIADVLLPRSFPLLRGCVNNRMTNPLDIWHHWVQHLTQCSCLLTGLADLDVSLCEVSDEWKRKLAELVLTYQYVFSKVVKQRICLLYSPH